MTTEAPLMKDGAQCQAAANYWNPASPLYGPQGSGQFLIVYLSGPRTLTLQTVAGAVSYGVLQNAPAQGQACDVAINGITKVVVGAAVTAGQELQSDTNGRAITFSSGRKVGMALESATGANAMIDMLVYTPNG